MFILIVSLAGLPPRISDPINLFSSVFSCCLPLSTSLLSILHTLLTAVLSVQVSAPDVFDWFDYQLSLISACLVEFIMSTCLKHFQIFI